MTNRDFCYWLEGFFEITEAQEVTEKQLTVIVEHLKLTSAREPLAGPPLWLDGFLKGIGPGKALNKEQTALIKAELKKIIINVMDEKGSFALKKLLSVPGILDNPPMLIC